MKEEYKEECPTKRGLKSLRSLKIIFPGNYKQAVSELNTIKGVKKKALIDFIKSVYDVEDKQVARAVTLECKRLTHQTQMVRNKTYKTRVTNRRTAGNRPRFHSMEYKLGLKAKKKALEKIDRLCGVCGGSKDKKDKKACKEKKKKKDDDDDDEHGKRKKKKKKYDDDEDDDDERGKRKKKKKKYDDDEDDDDDPCKTKKKSDPSKQKRKSDPSKQQKKDDPCKGKNKQKNQRKQKKKKPRKPTPGVTCSRKLHNSRGVKRARYDPNSIDKDSDEEAGSRSDNKQQGLEKKEGGTNEGNQNNKSNSKPESAPQKPLYIA